jgi:hypothetical protein
MVMNKNFPGFAGLIFFLLIICFTPVTLAQQNITVENNPQNFKIAETAAETDTADSIDNLKKMNASLKKDIRMLETHVDDLSHEVNALKTSKPLEQMIQDNWELLLVAFLIFILLFLLVYFLLKSINKKSINSNIEKMVNNTKAEILKEFKINETDFHNYATQSSAEKLENFNGNLENNYDNFNNKLQDSLSTELNEFKENVEHLIKRRLDK